LAVPFHYVHEKIANGTVKVDYIPTSQMPANGLTKPLTGLAFAKFVEMVGLLPVPSDKVCLQSRDVLKAPSLLEPLPSSPAATCVAQGTGF
jgi:hypothetical protein